VGVMVIAKLKSGNRAGAQRDAVRFGARHQRIDQRMILDHVGERLARFDFAFDLDPWFIVPALLGLVALAGPGRVEVGTDRQGGTISPHRVGAARAYTWIAAAAAALALEPAALAPVWAALAATGLRPR